jgi:transporter family-2 protein
MKAVHLNHSAKGYAGAVLGGLCLTAMLYLNGTLAQYITSSVASLVVHGVGTAAAALFLMMFRPMRPTTVHKAPLWSYAGGILGAIMVVVSNYTFNSRLGITGTFVLMLAGQTAVSLWIDQRGLMGMPQRKVDRVDVIQIFLVLLGCAMVIYAK